MKQKMFQELIYSQARLLD